jgi:apolipoprotein D and lipocalin family protein
MKSHRMSVILGIVMLAGLQGCGGGGNLLPLATVEHVDVQRYLGTWYEIGKLPNSFERDCVAVTATYSLLPNGNIKVLNQCKQGKLDGPVKKIAGDAWVTDPGTNAKLKVRFFWPFAGDYWILELGPDYAYAVVGEPGRNFFWILSRQPKMDETLYQSILERAKGLGFDIAKVEKTLQP